MTQRSGSLRPSQEIMAGAPTTAREIDYVEIDGPEEVQVGRSFEINANMKLSDILGSGGVYEIREQGGGIVEEGPVAIDHQVRFSKTATATGPITYELIVEDVMGNEAVDSHTVNIVEDSGTGGTTDPDPGEDDGEGGIPWTQILIALGALGGAAVLIPQTDDIIEAAK